MEVNPSQKASQKNPVALRRWFSKTKTLKKKFRTEKMVKKREQSVGTYY